MIRKIPALAAIAFALLLNSRASGQEIEGTYAKGKLTEVNNLLSGDEMENCSAESRRYAGTVTAVRFSVGRQIGGCRICLFDPVEDELLDPLLRDDHLRRLREPDLDEGLNAHHPEAVRRERRTRPDRGRPRQRPRGR